MSAGAGATLVTAAGFVLLVLVLALWPAPQPPASIVPEVAARGSVLGFSVGRGGTTRAEVERTIGRGGKQQHDGTRLDES